MERTQDNRSSERFDRLVLLFASRPRDGWEDVFEEAARREIERLYPPVSEAVGNE